MRTKFQLLIDDETQYWTPEIVKKAGMMACLHQNTR